MMRRPSFLKKVAPRIGFDTSAIQNWCLARCPERKEIGSSRRPYVEIEDPFAATRLEVLVRVRSAEDAGKMLSSAPESIRKWRLEKTSKMEMEEGVEEEKGLPAAAISDRPFRFPVPDASERDGALDIEATCKRTPWYHIADE